MMVMMMMVVVVVMMMEEVCLQLKGRQGWSKWEHGDAGTES